MDEGANCLMADTLIQGTTIVEKDTRSQGDVPIGGVIPWLNNITGVPNLPIGWALCDGSTINDALSPMNGQTIPDLNGDNRFLRGSDTAGGTGGSATSAHTHGLGAGFANISMSSGTNQLELEQDTTEGSFTKSHTVSTSIVAGSGTVNNNRTGLSGTSDSDSTAILPTYINVVWIMRIR